MEGVGVRFVCAQGKHLTCPPELLGKQFILCRCEYADDLFFIGLCPKQLSKALSQLQSVCGAIGLDISAAKTEWLYLSNPTRDEIQKCVEKRAEGVGCCNLIVLDGVPIKHSSCFNYLGSLISEDGGVSLETAARIKKSVAVLNRYYSLIYMGVLLNFV